MGARPVPGSGNVNSVSAGIILPQSTLSQPWFLVFALFVGFNTLIYLGLTVSKLIPWPPQVHPSVVRDILPVSNTEESAVTTKSHASLRSLGTPLVHLRHEAARQTIPQAMVLIGAVMLVVSLANLLLIDEHSTAQSIGGMVTAFVFISVSQIMIRTKLTASSIITIWSVLTVAIICEISFYAENHNQPIILVNALILLIMLAPISMSWTSGFLAGAVSASAVVASGIAIDQVASLSWAVASASAFIAGLVLLQLRMSIIDRLSLSQLRANALASTDVLTGVFSRTGLLSLAQTIATTALASNQQVHAVMCDVRDLKTVNADYGMDFGDEVLQVTAKALKQSVPAADLVARWDGDSFLTLGVGPIADALTLTEVVEQAISLSGISLGKRPISVSVRSAAGDPAHVTLEELVSAATVASNAQGSDELSAD